MDGKDAPPRAECRVYVLNGQPLYPHYTYPDHFVAPGYRTMSGDHLRALGAQEGVMDMWWTSARAKR